MTVKKLGSYIFIGVLYFFLALPFVEDNSLGAYSQIRLTSLLPMAAGLLCGLPGALACAAGNLAVDLYSGLDIYCLFGFLGNFFMAWLPYKLWHTLFFGGPCSLQYLGSPASIFKFVGVSVIASCASVGVIGAGGHLLGGFSFGSFFLPVAIQYYDFSLLGGMLIFQICLTVFHIRPHIPEDLYTNAYRSRYYIIDHILAAVIVVSACILATLTFRKERTDDPAILLLCMILFLCSLLLGCLPVARGKRRERKTVVYACAVGLQAQFVTVFLLILFMVLMITAIVSIRILYVDYVVLAGSLDQMSSLWMRVLVAVAVVGTFFIIALPLLLRRIWRIVIHPVRMAAGYTRQFVADGGLNEEHLLLEKTGNEIDQLGESINRMADDIRRFVEDIRLRTAKEQKLAAELDIARNIQQGMLPERWTGTGFDIVSFIRPARAVGGDFYHFSQLDEDRAFVCIADVSGKDISAAMFMVQAKILLEENCALPPGQMLTRVNDTLSRSNRAMMFVTVFAAVVDRREKRMTYANAGHNPPVCLNRGNVFWLDEEPDLVLGPMEGIQYSQHTMELGEDFRLFIYTDGVNEAEGKDGEQFGNERMFQTVEKAFRTGADCQKVLEDIGAEVFRFTEDTEQSDDITMLALHPVCKTPENI